MLERSRASDDGGASSPRNQALKRAPRPEASFTHSYPVAPGEEARPLRAAGQARGPLHGPPGQHGLLLNPKPGGAKAQHIGIPDQLVFYSWWNEEVATPPEFTPSGQGMGVRRQVQLKYAPKTAAFELSADDSAPSLALQIEHADGTPVLPAELHVGAKVRQTNPP
jgi:hypothetical protein